jgi:hypothetical protein
MRVPRMTELSYPTFPRRLFVAAGVLVLALMAAAVVVNRSGPNVRACARAAEHVMAHQNYSVVMMELIGKGSVPVCRGLSADQYSQALLDTYRIEYGGLLARSPVNYAVPPPSVKAASAMSESRSRQ